jgi:hypothetical protein
VARKFFDGVVAEATQLGLMSDEHFTVDGTLLEACASLKGLRRCSQKLSTWSNAGENDHREYCQLYNHEESS